MPGADFNRDNRGQRSVHNAVLVPEFYAKRPGDLIPIDARPGETKPLPLALEFQKIYGIDFFTVWPSGGLQTREQKIVRTHWKTGETMVCFALEIHRTTNPKNIDGPLHYSRADFWDMGMCAPEGNVEFYVLDWPKTKDAVLDAWTLSEKTKREAFGERVGDESPWARCLLVPIKWCRARGFIKFEQLLVAPTIAAAEIVKAYNKDRPKHG